MELDERLLQKVAAYKPSSEVLALLEKTPILLLVAISGGGKDTIKAHLLNTGKYHHIVSHTTRAPRMNHGVMEQEGVDYHFIDKAEAERLLDTGAYIEADQYATHIYGTSVSEIKQANREHKIATTDLTIEGAEHYLALSPSAKVVFLLPPSFDIWMHRLLSRYGGKPHQHDLYLRMHEAIEEIEHAMRSEQMYIVVNDDLDKTVKLVDEIAHGEPVEPHFQKAMDIATALVARIRTELAKMS